jgi:CHASE2 domain-containing sensor protein
MPRLGLGILLAFGLAILGFDLFCVYAILQGAGRPLLMALLALLLNSALVGASAIYQQTRLKAAKRREPNPGPVRQLRL